MARKKDEKEHVHDGKNEVRKSTISPRRVNLENAVYLRVRDVAALGGCSRSHVYDMVKRGLLPKPRKLTDNYSVWKKADVLAAFERMYAEAV